MMTTHQHHPLVADYLRRLAEEARRLPDAQARELLSDIEAHLADALGGAGSTPTEAEIRQVLDRLGDPAELVDAAGDEVDGSARRATSPGPGGAQGGSGQGAAAQGTAPSAGADRGGREAGALVLFVAAIVLVVFWPLAALAWVAALVLLVLSTRWTVTQKVWGAVVLGSGPLVLGAAGLAAFGMDVAEQTCTVDAVGVESCVSDAAERSWTPTVLLVLLVAYLVLYVVTLVRLARAAR